jgi:hypothetical protein
LCPARRNSTGFSWEDNSTARPTLLPSGRDYTGPAYSHWGKVGNSPAEPNGDGREFCALAGSNMYTYFGGGALSDRVGTNALKLRVAGPLRLLAAQLHAN